MNKLLLLHLALNKELQKTYLPASLIIGSPDKEDLPLLKGKQVAGQSLIYVCKNRSCKRPVVTVTDALKQLRRDEQFTPTKAGLIHPN